MSQYRIVECKVRSSSSATVKLEKMIQERLTRWERFLIFLKIYKMPEPKWEPAETSIISNCNVRDILPGNSYITKADR